MPPRIIVATLLVFKNETTKKRNISLILILEIRQAKIVVYYGLSMKIMSNI